MHIVDWIDVLHVAGSTTASSNRTSVGVGPVYRTIASANSKRFHRDSNRGSVLCNRNVRERQIASVGHNEWRGALTLQVITDNSEELQFIHNILI